MKHRTYQIDYSRYSFNAEDDWGCYNAKGNKMYGYYDREYLMHKYICDDGLQHNMGEHVAKWEYFNGKIPEGLQVDHIIPLKNGGTNKLSNLRLLTQADNNRNELTKINHSEAAKRRKHTDESKKKMSEARKGKNNTKKSLSVGQYTLNDELVAVWPSINEAGRNGFLASCICDCLKGIQKKHKGFKWKPIEKDEEI